jgi:hypothetical protein
VISVKIGTQQKGVQHFFLNWTEKHKRKGGVPVTGRGWSSCLYAPFRISTVLWLSVSHEFFTTESNQGHTTTQLCSSLIKNYSNITLEQDKRQWFVFVAMLLLHILGNIYFTYMFILLSLGNTKTRNAFLDIIRKATGIKLLWLTLAKSVHFLMLSHHCYTPNSSLYLIFNSSGKCSSSDVIPLYWKQGDSG